jgi:8-oxo-dGTP pyrophosphatase MutT (NUDIX family)
MSAPPIPQTQFRAVVTEVAGVVLLRSDGAALLQLREEKPGLPDAGNWVFPGGHCDAGEAIAVCARREFLEETTYRCESLQPLTDFDSGAGGRQRHFSFFWERFDAVQELECREGVALQFISRDKCPPNTPDYLPRVWDLAIAAAQAGPR